MSFVMNPLITSVHHEAGDLWGESTSTNTREEPYDGQALVTAV
jgi:hypothetical protein